MDKANEFIIKQDIIKEYFKMLSFGKLFESAKDDLIVTARELDPTVTNIMDAINLAKKLREEYAG